MNADCYFELRKPAERESDNIISDTMGHLSTRQHLGKALIICSDPPEALSAARKQWLKLARTLQKQRAKTLSADKILKYTYTITRMQRMHFTAKNPLERPNASIYLLSPDNLDAIPAQCCTVYLLCPLGSESIASLVTQLPESSLVIDYNQPSECQNIGLKPKKVLELRVGREWRKAEGYLKSLDINPGKLIIDGVIDSEAINDALDTLLGGHSHKFLQVANEFQRALELARPLHLKKSTRFSYDALVLLAHRVQALRPDAYSQRFLESYNEDDTFFLYDSSSAENLEEGETLTEASARHEAAGRHNLARSLDSLAKNNKPAQ